MVKNGQQWSKNDQKFEYFLIRIFWIGRDPPLPLLTESKKKQFFMPPLKGFYNETGFQFYNLEAQTGPVKYGFQNTKNQTKTVTIKNTGVIEKRISQFRFPTQPLSVLKIRKTKWFRLSF